MDWLIKALGGVTHHEYEMLKVLFESWRTRATAAETTVELFKEIMTRDQARYEKLEAKLSDARPETSHEPSGLDPVGDRRLSSWPRIKRELERQSRVKPNAEVPREEIEKTIREG